MELWTSTHGGALLAAAVLLPFVGMLLGLVLGGRQVQRVAFVLMPLGLALAVAIAVAWSDAKARWSTCSAAGRRHWASRCAPTARRWPCCWRWRGGLRHRPVTRTPTSARRRA